MVFFALTIYYSIAGYRQHDIADEVAGKRLKIVLKMLIKLQLG